MTKSIRHSSAPSSGVSRSDFLPTPIGNILRAAERRAVAKYGLDTVALWPRLWLGLPDTTRQELLAARDGLDNTPHRRDLGAAVASSPPSPPWPSPSPRRHPAAVTVVLPGRAQVFGDLIEAAHGLHRSALARQLRWPLPANPSQEHHQGQPLTAYLWRGSHRTPPTFTRPPEPNPGIHLKHLRAAADAIRLSRRAWRGDLFWAFAYKVAALPH